ncbi:MAG: diguanylate cyclase (GGDEF)-like protein [Planctomycetota bacterium]|jgi:diguanylate cyclase (GGDEF)-like protein
MGYPLVSRAEPGHAMNSSHGVRTLIGDHRGQGTTAWLAPLSSSGLDVDLSPTLAATLNFLVDSAPQVLVLDPLTRNCHVELTRITENLDPSSSAVLLVVDPSDPVPTIIAARILGSLPFDLVHRGAPVEEYQLRIEHLCKRLDSQGDLAEARYRAMHDDLTDLLRAKAFNARLFEHFSATQRHSLPMALVLMDLDRFGAVNKTFDHTTGDRLIAEVGRTIGDFLRAEDVGGRLGGDEFAMLLPYTGRVDAAHVVQRIRQRIERISSRLDASSAIHISTSIGFETYDGKDLDSVTTLRDHAERALKKAKARGGNCGVYFRTPDEPDSLEKSPAPLAPLAPNQ